MKQLIESVTSSDWFAESGPLCGRVTWGHHRLCVVTGPNASGKSVVRKILANRCRLRGWKYLNLSQEGRSTSHGLERLMVYGTETDESTGYNSVKTVRKCFQSIEGHDFPLAVTLDEPEIGCSEEVQAGIGQFVARGIEAATDNLLAMFVVTHSREVLRYLLPLNPTHWRLSEDGLGVADLISREVIPVDLDEVIRKGLETWGRVNRLFKARGQREP